MQYLYFDSEVAIAEKLTIFAIPKPFVGEIGTIQRNAIATWTKLNPKPEIILFGDEVGTSEIAAELSVIHIREIRRNQYGTPLLQNIFAETNRLASNDLIAYLNADIILTNDFVTAVTAIDRQLDKFLIIGRRWNIDFETALDFSENWASNLHQLVRAKGCLACYQCKDYFVFPKGLFARIPDFAVGRGYWDTWMVNYANDNNYPVVDASLGATVIHQNHDYAHIAGGKNEAYMGKEAEKNKSLADFKISGTIADATWQLKSSQTKSLPQVSIVVSSGEGIERTIASISSQKQDSYEIIAIADGSERKIKAIFPNNQNIKYLQSNKRNKLETYNLAWKMAKGEFIMFVDAGCLLLPNALTKQVANFESEASTLDVLLGGWQFIGNGQQIKTQPWLNLESLEDLHIWKLNRIYQSFNESTAMFRRSSLELVGGFNPQLVYRAAIVEAILALVFLKGGRAKWLKQSILNASQNFIREIKADNNLIQQRDSASRGNLGVSAVQIKQNILDVFYKRGEIKPWMLILKPEAERAILAKEFSIGK